MVFLMKNLKLGSLRSAFWNSSGSIQFRNVGNKKRKNQKPAGSCEKTKLRKKVMFTPTSMSFKYVENITSVAVALKHVAWASVSVSGPMILNWDAYSLPNEFYEAREEDVLLEIAQSVYNIIPSSALYVMESQRYQHLYSTNENSLKAMITAYLNPIEDGPQEPKAVFMKPWVLNNLFSLLVAGERTSSMKALNDNYYLTVPDCIVVKRSETGISTDSSSLIKLEDAPYFEGRSKEYRECLSYALLLALAFLDVGVFETSEALSKLEKKIRRKVII